MQKVLEKGTKSLLTVRLLNIGKTDGGNRKSLSVRVQLSAVQHTPSHRLLADTSISHCISIAKIGTTCSTSNIQAAIMSEQ